MKVEFSGYLSGVDQALIKLQATLQAHYDYASILATDVGGQSIQVGQRQKNVSDYWMSERGFVVRVCKDGLYSEYSFNSLEPDRIEKLADHIKKELDRQLDMIKESAYPIFQTSIMPEDALDLFIEKDVKILPESVTTQEIVDRLTSISDDAMRLDKRLLEFQCSVSMVRVSKLFVSAKRHLKQSYIWSEGALAALVRENDQTQMDYESYSGLKGAEILDEMEKDAKQVVNHAIELLAAEPVVPGEYDIICPPGIAGLIAHEAFGHGVEMDMFVKNRSLAADYIGKKIASDLVSMRDGAEIVDNTSSYAFDDEGVLAHDTTIIENGVLKSGIADALSALRLNFEPTGNGKRQSFERKVYARMTNTIFGKGNDSLDEMMASIKHGYLLEGVKSGMEDPKNWGIQCMLTRGREIKDGKLTGRIVAPVIMTGYVPDLLKSIDMVSNDLMTFGSGYCGKGHKEFVKVSDGGPYLKAKARLG